MSPRHRFIRLAICLTSLLMALEQVVGLDAFMHLPVAQAAGITVTTTTDELNNGGNCSLREAIQAASTAAAVDAIWSWRLMKDNLLVAAYYRAYYAQCQDAGLAGRCMGQWDSKWIADGGSMWDAILYNFYTGATLSLATPNVAVGLPPVVLREKLFLPVVAH